MKTLLFYFTLSILTVGLIWLIIANVTANWYVRQGIGANLILTWKPLLVFLVGAGVVLVASVTRRELTLESMIYLIFLLIVIILLLIYLLYGN